MAVSGLGLYHGNREVGVVAQNIVRALLLAPAGPAADEDDPAIGERPLLIDGMRPVVPACFLQLRDDKFAAGIGLVHRCTPKPTYADSATRGWPVVAEAAGEANDQTLTARPTRSIWREAS